MLNDLMESFQHTLQTLWSRITGSELPEGFWKESLNDPRTFMLFAAATLILILLLYKLQKDQKNRRKRLKELNEALADDEDYELNLMLDSESGGRMMEQIKSQLELTGEDEPALPVTPKPRHFEEETPLFVLNLPGEDSPDVPEQAPASPPKSPPVQSRKPTVPPEIKAPQAPAPVPEEKTDLDRELEKLERELLDALGDVDLEPPEPPSPARPLELELKDIIQEAAEEARGKEAPPGPKPQPPVPSKSRETRPAPAAKTENPGIQDPARPAARSVPEPKAQPKPRREPILLPLDKLVQEPPSLPAGHKAAREKQYPGLRALDTLEQEIDQGLRALSEPAEDPQAGPSAGLSPAAAERLSQRLEKFGDRLERQLRHPEPAAAAPRPAARRVAEIPKTKKKQVTMEVLESFLPIPRKDTDDS